MRKLLDNALTLFIIGIIFLLIVPLGAGLLDVMLIINIAFSLIILLISMHIREPLEFSVFPSVLLVTTLLRVSLSVSATRLILGNGGDAGQVIRTFGNFVVGGNVVVGFVVFLIIVVVQFIVITKGAERVAEVAARFTLDAMPGKQMAVDADLNSGLIDEATARQRRQKVQREADFYGSMDGASKFIKGDAIMSIITLFVNSLGGIIIGMVMGGKSITEVLNVYIIATVGDGLVSQIPALLISTATGMVVTRAASVNSFSEDLKTQIISYPIALTIAGGVLITMSMIPGFPVIVLLIVGGALIFLAAALTRRKPQTDAQEEKDLPVSESEFYRNTENIYSLLAVEPIEVNVGYSLIPLVDEAKGGNFINRVVMLRRQFAEEMGMVVPAVTLRDDAQLGVNEYAIKVKGEVAARGEVLADHFLAMNPIEGAQELDGIDTIEPAFEIPAKWIAADLREMAQMSGYTVIDPLSVIVTHLSEVIKQNAKALFGRKELILLLDNLRKVNKELVDDLVPGVVSHLELQKVLGNLLGEQIPIRDFETILETVGEYAPTVKDSDLITEYVRQALRRTITRRFAQDGSLKVITLNPEIENLIMGGVRKSGANSYVSLEPEVLQNIVNSHMEQERKLKDQLSDLIVLTSPVVRCYYKKLIEQFSSDAVVLSFSEINNDVNIQALGTISI
ncbi:flagellar biosynthesis protein FlhA [Bacillota bacterium Meth-B3]|nr:flagellar biosynthesis protein FlhA [Christensenellaceae bacterium]MEA5064531.1 flagellar biosynthesis protein FlhA [Eubacteriales bacterium]